MTRSVGLFGPVSVTAANLPLGSLKVSWNGILASQKSVTPEDFLVAGVGAQSPMYRE